MEILIGHLVGDYLLQTGWMASNKTKWSLIGWTACILHCVIYTIIMACCVRNFHFIGMAIVFAQHLIADKSRAPVEFYMRHIQKFKPWPPHYAWVILYDNCFHLLTAWLVYDVFKGVLFL